MRAHIQNNAALCYIASVTPVKRDRMWKSAESAATKAAVSAMECGFVVRAPFYGGSMGRRKPGRFAQAGSRSSTPIESPPLRGSSAVVYANRTRLEAIMATSLNAAHICASPTTGTDPIQLHADAHNALNMAVYYLRQPQANTAAARRKAVQALAALRNLSALLEA